MHFNTFDENMSDSKLAPFSARIQGTHRQIDKDFPQSARIALLHLLHASVEKRYVADWYVIARELQRIGRQAPVEYSTSGTGLKQAKEAAEETLYALPWQKAFDFCERLHGVLAQEVVDWWNDEPQLREARTDVQAFIESEIQNILLEEGLAFEFTQGMVRRRGRKHTVDVTTRAQVVLGDPRLTQARNHYAKAIGFFTSLTRPDYENAVKEAVCAVEAAGKALFPDAKSATLGDLAKWFASKSDSQIPKALTQTITGIYAFRSGGDGVGHGGASGGKATAGVAEYVLAVCASQIIYFVDVANSQENEVPF